MDILKHAELKPAVAWYTVYSICFNAALYYRLTFQISDQLTQDACYVFCVSTGCLSKDSYHCIVDPIKNAQLPQKVASAASYSAPLLPYAGPSAPESCGYVSS